MLVLDTDVLSFVQRKAGEVYARLRTRLDATTEPVFATIISYEEQSRGWLALLARARTVERHVEAYRRLRRQHDDYRDMQVLDFDDRSATFYRYLVSLRIRIGTMDRRIAAIA